ncbi:MAG: mechanosensitive ion channel family protein [Chloroflexota bacterium]|nr:MAG: mechanosensitive ion channel family protein [Chloroflexota bacterium]
MDILEYSFYENTVQSWLIAFAAFVLTVLVLQFIKRVLEKRVVALIKKSQSKIDDYLLPLLRQTRFFFLLTVGVYVGNLYLFLPTNIHVWVGKITRLVFFIQIGLWGSALIAYFITCQVSEKIEEDQASDATTIDALGLISKITLWTIIGLLVLDNLGVKVDSLIASLGIGGIAIALALQNILGDLFASLSIALDKPFVIGDFIVLNGFEGTVEDIGLKSTRVRSLSGEEIIFANTDLLNSRIRNYKWHNERRIAFSIGVTYGTPTEKLAQIPSIVKEIISPLEHIRFERAHFSTMADFSLNYDIVYYVQDPDANFFLDFQQEINLALYERFAEEGIEFAYPTQTLYIAK